VVESPAAMGSARTPNRQNGGFARFRSLSHRWPSTCFSHSHAIYRRAGVRKLLLIPQPVQMTLESIGLEGKLIGAWIGETRQIVAKAGASSRVCLNLQGLTFADSRAIELLRTLRREGIPLLGCPLLIEGLLAANEVSANAIPSSTARAPDDKDPKCS
jgi:hypothetical protein